jgi:hypothetical protein
MEQNLKKIRVIVIALAFSTTAAAQQDFASTGFDFGAGSTWANVTGGGAYGNVGLKSSTFNMVSTQKMQGAAFGSQTANGSVRSGQGGSASVNMLTGGGGYTNLSTSKQNETVVTGLYNSNSVAASSSGNGVASGSVNFTGQAGGYSLRSFARVPLYGK